MRGLSIKGELGITVIVRDAKTEFAILGEDSDSDNAWPDGEHIPQQGTAQCTSRLSTTESIDQLMVDITAKFGPNNTVMPQPDCSTRARSASIVSTTARDESAEQ